MTPNGEVPFGISGLGWMFIVLVWLPLCAWLLVVIGRRLRGRVERWLTFTLLAERTPFARPEIQKIPRSRGIGVISFLLLVPATLVVAVVLVVGFYEGRKAYWDYKVREMCELDGGITVLEHVRLSAYDYRRLGGTNGEIAIPERGSAPPMAEYVSDTIRTEIRHSDPNVWRTEATIRAVAGNRSLARYVNYSRRGGDFPTFAHPSVFSCDLGIGSVSKRVFVVEGESN